MNKFNLLCASLILILLSSISNVCAQSAITETPMILQTPTGALHGSLLLPGSKPRYPVVLIIAGSGPTDRNGNSPVYPGPNNSLKMLAEGLAAQGIASLRYDKRGMGESSKAMGKEADLIFSNYIDDAVLWSKQLRQDKRFTTLTIVGHSEGSLIGMVAAQGKNADGFMSLAGPGRPAGQMIIDQVRPQLSPNLLKSAEEIVALLTAGKNATSVPVVFNAFFRPSVQPYLISWFRFDPAQEIAKLSIPVLIAQGTTDIQVSVEEAKLLAKAKPSAQLLLVEGMNHVLKDVANDRTTQIKSYSDPSLQIVPQLITETVKFVKKVKKQKS